MGGRGGRTFLGGCYGSAGGVGEEGAGEGADDLREVPGGRVWTEKLPSEVSDR